LVGSASVQDAGDVVKHFRQLFLLFHNWQQSGIKPSPPFGGLSIPFRVFAL